MICAYNLQFSGYSLQSDFSLRKQMDIHRFGLNDMILNIFRYNVRVHGGNSQLPIGVEIPRFDRLSFVWLAFRHCSKGILLHTPVLLYKSGV